MRASRMHIHTYREDPADAEVTSHRLMARAGLVHKLSGGVYTFSPMLLRVIRKIERIIRQELEREGALELQLPLLQDQQVWEQSGRWKVYQASRTMLTVTDRKGQVFGLSPTAEEVVTDFVRATVKSYRQLPVNLYQIHTKFRDEIRPRFGLLRVKEFLMKDAYSFDVDAAGLDVSYEAMRRAYHAIFRRLGLEAFGVDADPGDIGGSGSMEFMLAADAGEDSILLEPGSDYAANVEKAQSRFSAAPGEGDAPRPQRVEDTPGIRSCEELNRFFPDVPVAGMVKTILFVAVHVDHEQLWAACIRGDQEINEVKLKNHCGGLTIRMLTDAEIEAHTGATQGFAGPIRLPGAFQLVADETTRSMRNFLCGLNESDRHALDVNWGRDLPMPTFADLRLARAGEPGPRTGAPLQLRRGIEVGHIFKLGTKYSAAMGATFTDVSGRDQPFVMGCYGIGVSRIAAAAVEQYADTKGICWPVPMAPFEVVVASLGGKSEEHRQMAEQVVARLEGAGVEVLWDDRDLSPGARLADHELLGFPFAILVGRAWKERGELEVRVRAGSLVSTVPVDAALEQVVEHVRVGRLGLPS